MKSYLVKEAPQAGCGNTIYRIARLRLTKEEVGELHPYRQRHSGRNQSGSGMSAPAAAPPHQHHVLRPQGSAMARPSAGRGHGGAHRSLGGP